MSLILQMYLKILFWNKKHWHPCLCGRSAILAILLPESASTILKILHLKNFCFWTHHIHTYCVWPSKGKSVSRHIFQVFGTQIVLQANKAAENNIHYFHKELATVSSIEVQTSKVLWKKANQTIFEVAYLKTACRLLEYIYSHALKYVILRSPRTSLLKKTQTTRILVLHYVSPHL